MRCDIMILFLGIIISHIIISQLRKLRLSEVLPSPGQDSNSSLRDPRVSNLHAVCDRTTPAFLKRFLVPH